MSSVSVSLVDEESRAARVSALQDVLRARFPAAAPDIAPRAEGVLDTGVEALDRLLPRGGLPRGQVTEWVVARSGGSATLLRRLVLHWARPDEKVALVDAGRTLAAADWVTPARSAALTFVRPPEPQDGPWCAELLLRTGGFSLVVLDGVGLRARAAQRLSHLARESDNALLVIRPTWTPDRAGRGGLATVRIRLLPADSPLLGPGKTPPVRAPITAALTKGGAPAQVEVSRETIPTHWLCVHPLVPDRRGGATRGRSW
jgi:hypothetical protein